MGNLAITFGNGSMFPLQHTITLWMDYVNEKVCEIHSKDSHLQPSIVHRLQRVTTGGVAARAIPRCATETS